MFFFYINNRTLLKMNYFTKKFFFWLLNNKKKIYIFKISWQPKLYVIIMIKTKYITKQNVYYLKNLKTSDTILKHVTCSNILIDIYNISKFEIAQTYEIVVFNY